MTMLHRLPTDVIARGLADEVTRVIAGPRLWTSTTLNRVDTLLAELLRRAEGGDREAARCVADHEVDRMYAGITPR